MAAKTGRRGKKSLPLLKPGGWTEKTRLGLEKLIRKGSGENLPVVFDFDNTIICGDIGEATFAVLARDGLLSKKNVTESLSPSFRLPGGKLIQLGHCADVTEYYEAFLAPTAHGANDPSPLANGYVWIVEIMEGLSPLDVVCATAKAFNFSLEKDGQPKRSEPVGRQTWIEVTPGKTAFRVPFFYDEMIDLIASLLRHDFDVWIVSASNVWTVRWMVAHALNPRLRDCGVERGITPDHVIGISTLMRDSENRLYKDAVLVREDRRYAALDERTLKRLRLTSRLQFPVPIYSGKLACIADYIGQQPWLGVGDGQGDHPMLACSQNRLWIARLENPLDQKATAELIQRCSEGKWLAQPVLAKGNATFVADVKRLANGGITKDVRASLKILGKLS